MMSTQVDQFRSQRQWDWPWLTRRLTNFHFIALRAGLDDNGEVPLAAAQRDTHKWRRAVNAVRRRRVAGRLSMASVIAASSAVPLTHFMVSSASHINPSSMSRARNSSSPGGLLDGWGPVSAQWPRSGGRHRDRVRGAVIRHCPVRYPAPVLVHLPLPCRAAPR